MGFTGGIILAAIGAILRFAVDVQTDGFNVHTVGVILMITGVVIALLSLAFWSTWGGFHHTEVVDGPTHRRVIDEY